MTVETYEIKEMAKEGKNLYLIGKIDKKEAIKYMKPYIDKFNEVSKEKAEKYNLKANLTNFNKLIRSSYF